MRPPSRAAGWRGLLAAASVAVVADQVTKAALVTHVDPGERVDVLPLLDFVHVLNRGVAFGFLGDGSAESVILVTLAALLFVLGWFALDARRPWAWLAVGLLVGGALGNLADRSRQDAVIDFIDLPLWPAFNLADIAITAGAGLLVLAALGAGAGEGNAAGGDDG